MNKLEMLYNRYGRKIWLTEFAKCCTRDQKEVETFVKVRDPKTKTTLTRTVTDGAGHYPKTRGSRVCVPLLLVHNPILRQIFCSLEHY